MTDKDLQKAFNESERAALHSLADMFGKSEDREKLRILLRQGVTLTQLVDAYKGQRWFIGTLKTLGVMAVAGTAIAAAAKGVATWGGMK